MNILYPLNPENTPEDVFVCFDKKDDPLNEKDLLDINNIYLYDQYGLVYTYYPIGEFDVFNHFEDYYEHQGHSHIYSYFHGSDISCLACNTENNNFFDVIENQNYVINSNNIEIEHIHFVYKLLYLKSL